MLNCSCSRGIIWANYGTKIPLATKGTMQKGQEPIDFNGENLNHWSWEGKITPKVIHGFLQYLSDLMQWLNTEGKALLEREGPLTHDEWHPLFDKVFNLWYQMGTDRAICLLFMAAVKKGISSLTHMSMNPPEDPEQLQRHQNLCREWFQTIQYQLRPNGRLGIGSHSCKVDESRELIASMIPIARNLKGEILLQEIARDRFVNDPEAQALFFAKHKDW